MGMTRADLVVDLHDADQGRLPVARPSTQRVHVHHALLRRRPHRSRCAAQALHLGHAVSSTAGCSTLVVRKLPLCGRAGRAAAPRMRQVVRLRTAGGKHNLDRDRPVEKQWPRRVSVRMRPRAAWPERKRQEGLKIVPHAYTRSSYRWHFVERTGWWRCYPDRSSLRPSLFMKIHEKRTHCLPKFFFKYATIPPCRQSQGRAQVLFLLYILRKGLAHRAESC